MPLPSEIFEAPSFDARTEYERVKALYDAYPLKAENKTDCDQYTIGPLKKILEGLPETPSARFLNELYATIYGLYELENFTRHRPQSRTSATNFTAPIWRGRVRNTRWSG
jgi:hypothetical protein